MFYWIESQLLIGKAAGRREKEVVMVVVVMVVEEDDDDDDEASMSLQKLALSNAILRRWLTRVFPSA